MHTLVRYALFAVLATITYRLVALYIREKQFRAFAKKHGCKQPRTIYRSLWQIVKRLHRMSNILTTGEDLFDDFLAPEFQDTNTIFEYSPIDLKGSYTTNEPKNIQAMLSTQFNDFETGDWRYQVFKPVLGRSIFTSDGAFWEHSRALMRPQFAKENINDLEFTDQATDRFIECFGRVDGEGWTPKVTVLNLLVDLTLATGTHFSFAHAIDLQAEVVRDEHKHAFADDLELVSQVLVRRARYGILKWVPGLIPDDGARYRRALDSLISSVDGFIDEAVHDRVKGQDGEHEKQSRRHSLVRGLAEQIQDPEEIRRQSMAVLMAGRDTTAALLSWCLVRLALHPDIFEKLRAIVLSEFPGTATYAQLKSCKYLHYFMNEVMRLHPNIPFNNRIAVRDTTLPVGGGPDQSSPMAVRAGTMVNFSIYFLQRRKDLWGEDALEFKPERWETARPQWSYLPFLAGPRTCPGQEFARTEAAFVLLKILQRFTAIEPVDREKLALMRKGMGFVMAPLCSDVRFKQAS